MHAQQMKSVQSCTINLYQIASLDKSTTSWHVARLIVRVATAHNKSS